MGFIRSLLAPATLAMGIMALVFATTHAQAPGSTAGPSPRGTGGAQVPQPTITTQQMERLEARIGTAIEIMNRLEREAKSRGLASGWRQATLETLLPLSLDGLRQVEQQAFNLDALAGATKGAADDPSLLGDLTKDLVYTPITPCRFIDTRNVGGKISGKRVFDANNPGSIYGGIAACNPSVLFGVVGLDVIGALAMNVTLVDTSTGGAPGFVAVKPSSNSPVTSLLNWYDQGPAVQVANQGIVSLSSTDQFVIETSGAVHIIVDIFGAFIVPQATALQTDHLVTVVMVPHLAAGNIESPVCPAGYALTGGGCFTDQFGHYLSQSYPAGASNRWACRSHNTSGVTSDLAARAICSRTSGR